jgi:hypothetical protein
VLDVLTLLPAGVPQSPAPPTKNTGQFLQERDRGVTLPRLDPRNTGRRDLRRSRHLRRGHPSELSPHAQRRLTREQTIDHLDGHRFFSPARVPLREARQGLGVLRQFAQCDVLVVRQNGESGFAPAFENLDSHLIAGTIER